MPQTNRKPNVQTIDPYDPARYGGSRRWLSVLIIWPLPILVVILAAFVAIGPALAFSDGSLAPAGGPGLEAAHASAAVANDDGQSPTAPSDFLDEVTLWSATMTARAFPRAADFYGYSSYDSLGALDTDTFVADGKTYTVNVLALSPFGNALGIRLSPDLDTLETSQLILLVDGLDFSFSDAGISLGYEENETLVLWENTGLSWEDGQQVSLRLIEWEIGTCPVGEDVPADVQEAVEDPS